MRVCCLLSLLHLLQWCCFFFVAAAIFIFGFDQFITSRLADVGVVMVAVVVVVVVDVVAAVVLNRLRALRGIQNHLFDIKNNLSDRSCLVVETSFKKNCRKRCRLIIDFSFG